MYTVISLISVVILNDFHFLHDFSFLSFVNPCCRSFCSSTIMINGSYWSGSEVETTSRLTFYCNVAVYDSTSYFGTLEKWERKVDWIVSNNCKIRKLCGYTYAFLPHSGQHCKKGKHQDPWFLSPVSINKSPYANYLLLGGSNY